MRLNIFPFRQIRRVFNDFVNKSNSVSADWIRRYRIRKFIDNARKNDTGGTNA